MDIRYDGGERAFALKLCLLASWRHLVGHCEKQDVEQDKFGLIHLNAFTQVSLPSAACSHPMSTGLAWFPHCYTQLTPKPKFVRNLECPI